MYHGNKQTKWGGGMKTAFFLFFISDQCTQEGFQSNKHLFSTVSFFETLNLCRSNQTGGGVLCGEVCCTFVCSDPPCCLGLQDKHNTHQVLGGKVVECLHGDGPWQTSSPAANDVGCHPWLPLHS